MKSTEKDVKEGLVRQKSLGAECSRDEERSHLYDSSSEDRSASFEKKEHDRARKT